MSVSMGKCLGNMLTTSYMYRGFRAGTYFDADQK
jgi:hypothetical protein